MGLDRAITDVEKHLQGVCYSSVDDRDEAMYLFSKAKVSIHA